MIFKNFAFRVKRSGIVQLYGIICVFFGKALRGRGGIEPGKQPLIISCSALSEVAQLPGDVIRVCVRSHQQIGIG